MTTVPSFVDTQVGCRAQALREAAGLSIYDAATLIKISPDDYTRLEAGTLRFRAVQLISLATQFGVSVSTFFEDVEVGSFHIHGSTTVATYSNLN